MCFFALHIGILFFVFFILISMSYFNYHATAKKLIQNGHLVDYYFTTNHNGIRPALVLVFNDAAHPIMPIRKERWSEYIKLLTDYNL